jgi:hypothetical protein
MLPDPTVIGMPRQRTFQRLCLLYEQSQGAQPDIRQIREEIGVGERTAKDYYNTMRRINILAQTIGKTDPYTRAMRALVARVAPRDNRPNLRRVQRKAGVSYPMVDIADTPLLSDAPIKVKELTCPGPAKQRITSTRCPFDHLDEKEKVSCEKCQKKGYSRKLPEWKARVSIWIEGQAFEESVLKCAREVEARKQMLQG